MRDIRLYINNEEVHLPEGIALPITYSQEDFSNPTAIKNSFSKTITIPGDDKNNKIFGEIYKLDRFITDHYGNATVGVKFDPSKRVDFKLFNNGDIIESGYMQLNTVAIKDRVISYDITLFGGIGDFFYGLSTREDGEVRTLADLQYFIEKDGEVLPEATEMDFTINKDIVYKSFTKDWSKEGNELTDIVAFIPSYNGVYDNFSGDSCLINTNGTDLFPKEHTVDGVTYKPYNGYALAELNNTYNEWEVRDLRSYYQRPAIKLSKLIETICRKENSGYDVIFDKDFFNETNPYWSKTFVAFPLLGSDTESETETKKYQIKPIDSDLWLGTDNIDNPIYTDKIRTETYFTEDTGDIIDISDNPEVSLGSITVPVSLRFNNLDSTNAEELLFVCRRYWLGWGTSVAIDNTRLVAVISVYDENDELIASDGLSFTSTVGGEIYNPKYNNKTLTPVVGSFKKKNGYYIFEDNNGFNSFNVTVSNISYRSKYKVKLELVREGQRATPWSRYLFERKTYEEQEIGIAGKTDILTSNDNTLLLEWESQILTGSLITKKSLLKTEDSCLDYLLSFTKLFGLYFRKDVASKTVEILTRNNFFKKEIEDFSNRLDYSKDMSINPIIFDKKWYKLALNTPETYYAKKYNTDYDLVYGQQRLNTGYNFNAETTDLYTDNIYENVISIRDVDKYYRTYLNQDQKEVPCFISDNITYRLYDTDLKEDEQDLYGVNYVSRIKEWWNVAGNDFMPKTCFFSLNDEEKTLEDIKASILIWNGLKDLKTYQGDEVVYWLTDDVPEMTTLNEEPCWIYTESEYNEKGNKIAYKLNQLPQYLRYDLEDLKVVKSLDLGLPREEYIGGIDYAEDTTIYNQYWDSFYKDQFNVNTKKLICFVKLNDLVINQDTLRKFYYFNNSYWLLNKIDSYDINSDKTTRCEFIYVNNIYNYGNN